MKRLAVLIAICGLCLYGCKETPEESLNVNTYSEPTAEVSAEAWSEESLPEKTALVLLYEYYIRAYAERDGFTYEYTYCIDSEGFVFNAEAVITFPAEEDAETEYIKLLQAEYPNLEADGATLSFAFPRKECPYFGVSYTALPYLLQETIYTVTDSVLPEKSESSESDFIPFD